MLFGFVYSASHKEETALIIKIESHISRCVFVQVSKEGDVYEVPRKVGLMSCLVKETLGDEDEDDDEDSMTEIPLPNVRSVVLVKVIEYCKHYQEEEMRQIQTPLKADKLKDLVQQWYADFVQVDRTLLFDLVAAANFMDIKPLLDLTCLAVAIQIKGKSAQELRQMFNISNEYTPEEQAQIANENEWVERPPNAETSNGENNENAGP